MADPIPPKAFIWRRLHSLTGIWLTIYLIMHLLTNSQAALLLGDDGQGFIHSVNSIHHLPFLPVIEIATLAVPILIHSIWGILYILEAKYNSFGKVGKDPYLPEYPRNHAYTWQRITAWILVLGIAAHVIHMRIIEYPDSAMKGDQRYFMVRVNLDEGIYTLASRLNVQLYDPHQIEVERKEIVKPQEETSKNGNFWEFLSSLNGLYKKTPSEKPSALIEKQKQVQDQGWLQALQKKPLGPGQAIAVAKDFGTVELLMLRETFKMPFMIVIYTLFVLTACFHGFNGLWTFLITWGVSLTKKSQALMRTLSTGLMVIVAFLGLSAIWLTYWVNLKQ